MFLCVDTWSKYPEIGNIWLLTGESFEWGLLYVSTGKSIFDAHCVGQSVRLIFRLQICGVKDAEHHVCQVFIWCFYHGVLCGYIWPRHFECEAFCVYHCLEGSWSSKFFTLISTHCAMGIATLEFVEDPLRYVDWRWHWCCQKHPGVPGNLFYNDNVGVKSVNKCYSRTKFLLGFVFTCVHKSKVHVETLAWVAVHNIGVLWDYVPHFLMNECLHSWWRSDFMFCRSGCLISFHGPFAYFVRETGWKFVVSISAEGLIDAFTIFMNGVYNGDTRTSKSTVP